MSTSMILFDIGSTFTKVTVDTGKLRSLPSPAHPPLSRCEHGLAYCTVRLGFSEEGCSRSVSLFKRCRRLAHGGHWLWQDLTAKAAKLAALGAGQVLNTYSFQLTEADREEIAELKPDIILLAGGTDGGNTENILHNAKVLASLPDPVPVVIAGNRSVASEVASCFPEAFSTYIAPNVMPQIGKLQVDPAREVIRKVFMEKIIHAKGLDKAERWIDGIFMPTPAAVLHAGQLLSQGTASKRAGRPAHC